MTFFKSLPVIRNFPLVTLRDTVRFIPILKIIGKYEFKDVRYLTEEYRIIAIMKVETYIRSIVGYPLGRAVLFL